MVASLVQLVFIAESPRQAPTRCNRLRISLQLPPLAFDRRLARDLAIFVSVDEYVLGSGNEAVLYAAISPEGFLVGPGVEKANVEGFFVVDHRKKNLAGVGFGIIVVHAVAGKSAHVHFVIRIIPFVDGQQNILLVHSPGVRKVRDK